MILRFFVWFCGDRITALWLIFWRSHCCAAGDISAIALLHCGGYFGDYIAAPWLMFWRSHYCTVADILAIAARFADILDCHLTYINFCGIMGTNGIVVIGGRAP